jgi:site-specific recombinase XerD
VANQRLDRLGRPYTPMMDPALRRGRRPPNYGRRFPAEPLTNAEVAGLIAACPRRGPSGLRDRALIVVLWRAGLRIAEALALELRDVDRDAGTLTIRHGKGNRRRVVGLDPTAMAVLERWLDARAGLGVPRGSRVFCTISQPNPGRSYQAPQAREMLKRRAQRAGIEKRVHPHGLRHTCAVDLLREGLDVKLIQRQLGHSDLRTTDRYVDHLLPAQLVERMRNRDWPNDVAA